MSTLPDSLMQRLIAQLDDENTIGVTVQGSFARGEAGPYSDVDVWYYVRQMSAGKTEPYHLRFVDGYLVSYKKTTLESEYASLRNPEQAIWAIPGLRQARILLDKDGSITTLKETAVRTTWEALQNAANAYASWNLSAAAEEVYKILDGLARQDESKTLYSVWGLTRELAKTLLVQRGALIPSENAFIGLAQETAGRTSGWTRQFRLAIGLDLVPGVKPAFRACGIAGLGLYRETAVLLGPVLLPEDVAVVDHILEDITQAGY